MRYEVTSGNASPLSSSRLNSRNLHNRRSAPYKWKQTKLKFISPDETLDGSIKDIDEMAQINNINNNTIQSADEERSTTSSQNVTTICITGKSPEDMFLTKSMKGEPTTVKRTSSLATTSTEAKQSDEEVVESQVDMFAESDETIVNQNVTENHSQNTTVILSMSKTLSETLPVENLKSIELDEIMDEVDNNCSINEVNDINGTNNVSDTNEKVDKDHSNTNRIVINKIVGDSNDFEEMFEVMEVLEVNGLTSKDNLDDTVAVENVIGLTSNDTMPRCSTTVSTLPITDSVFASPSFSLDSQDMRPVVLVKDEPNGAVYPDLVNCDEPINRVIEELINPHWVDHLKSSFSDRNIKVVGDLASLTEAEINRLPVKGSCKFTFVRKVLARFKNQLEKEKIQGEKANDENTRDADKITDDIQSSSKSLIDKFSKILEQCTDEDCETFLNMISERLDINKMLDWSYGTMKNKIQKLSSIR